MSVHIGIFNKEEEVVEAIRMLREAGVDHDGIRVIVKNAENAPLIASRTDIAVEDLTDIEDARDRDTGVTDGLPIGVVGVTAGNLGSGAPFAGYPGGFVIGAFDWDEDNGDRERVLRDVGVPDHAAERCEDEVGAGRYLVLADSDEDTNAPTILRHAGASDVLH